MQGLLFIIEIWDNIWCNLMHLKKSIMRLQDRAFTNCNIVMDTSIKRILKMKNFIILNKRLYSNWQTIYPKLKYPHNGSHIKVPLFFWFLLMTFNSCFHHQLLIKSVCIQIEQNHSQFPKCLNVWCWMKCISN